MKYVTLKVVLTCVTLASICASGATFAQGGGNGNGGTGGGNAQRCDIGDDEPWRPGLKSDKCDARQNGRQNGHERGRPAPDVANRGREPCKERTLRHSYAVTRRAWRNR
jgi:hypothetical protein